MTLHKNLIYATSIITLLLAFICLSLTKYSNFDLNYSFSVLFWILVGVTGSSFVVLTTEIINYCDSKEKLILEYCAECCKLTNILKKLRFGLAENRHDYLFLKEILRETSELNIYPCQILYGSFNFFKKKSDGYLFVNRVWHNLFLITSAIMTRREFFLYNTNELMIKNNIDEIVKIFEVIQNLDHGAQRLTDIVEIIENDVFSLQEFLYKKKVPN